MRLSCTLVIIGFHFSMLQRFCMVNTTIEYSAVCEVPMNFLIVISPFIKRIAHMVIHRINHYNHPKFLKSHLLTFKIYSTIICGCLFFLKHMDDNIEFNSTMNEKMMHLCLWILVSQ